MFEAEEKSRLNAFAREKFGVDGHVLPEALALENLHPSFRDDVMPYFDRHAIKWWAQGKAKSGSEPKQSLPTGHLNSSQVACVNHLEPARQDVEIARSIVRQIDNSLVDVMPVEDAGYVAYEWIGQRSYLGESRGRVRGANVTSLDALMVGRRDDNTACLVVIEW